MPALMAGDAKRKGGLPCQAALFRTTNRSDLARSPATAGDAKLHVRRLRRRADGSFAEALQSAIKQRRSISGLTRLQGVLSLLSVR